MQKSIAKGSVWLMGKRIGKILTIVAGAVVALVLAVPVFMEANLALTCGNASPACLPRYRAAGHFWSRLGLSSRAQHWYKRGATSGDPIAMFHLGWMHERVGWSRIVSAGEVQHGRLVEYMERLSKFLLGIERNIEVTEGQTLRRLLLRPPSEFEVTQDEANSLRHGATELAEGNSLASDARAAFTLAAYWYGLASKQGFAPAMNNLGTMHVNGGQPQDLDTAKELVLGAAELNNPVAALNMVVLAKHPRIRDEALARRFRESFPEKANPADLAEPTFERTNVAFGSSLPLVKRAEIRDAARRHISIPNFFRPLTPDPRIPTFRETVADELRKKRQLEDSAKQPQKLE